MDNDQNKINRRECPHHATVTLKIDIRKMNSDNTIDPEIMGNILLHKYGISTKAQIEITGHSEADCILNLKRRLERLNE